jgi:hypothetical protein
MPKLGPTPDHVSASGQSIGLALVNPYLEKQDIHETLAFTARPARISYPNGVQRQQSRHYPKRLRQAKIADGSAPVKQAPPK